MNKKTSPIGLLLIFMVCLSASCAGGSSAPAGKPLKVEWSLWQGDYTLLVANQMGFFKKHGVNVEPVRYEFIYTGNSRSGRRKIGRRAFFDERCIIGCEHRRSKSRPGQ